MSQRRDLLKAAAAAGLVGVGRSAFAALAPVSSAAPRRLVVVFMRGAVDGLSVVVPHADGEYYRARPTIALARPGQDGGVLDLDARFGLHPALSALMPLWQAGKLGFVQASGSPDTTRSHFDAQDYMESGTPGVKTTPDGWLNRLLGALPAMPAMPAVGGETAPTMRAVSVGAVLPRIWAGRNAVANLASGAAATRPTVLDRPAVEQAFAQLYAGEGKLARAWRQSQQSHREVMGALSGDDLEREMQAANNGAPLPGGFAADAARLARLMRRDGRVQLAFMAVGGWDTHANQGSAAGQLASRLRPLGEGLAQMAQQLGPVLDDTVVVVMSEFGRTMRENGNRGTDHGHGNVMWLLGGAVAGGRVHGRWPGLGAGALYEGRDLAVTTDFRQVIAQLCERHLALPDAKLADVFPNFTDDRAGLALLRA